MSAVCEHRCPRCDRPLGDGCDGDVLCAGPSIDWRARALAAEATRARIARASIRRIAHQRGEVARLRAALRRCAAHAGHVYASDGCRLVISTAREALNEPRKA